MTNLASLIQNSTKQSPFFSKGVRMAQQATQFIGQGSQFSSTQAYAQTSGRLANTGHYTSADTIFISAEGARSGRFNPIGCQGPRGAYLNINTAIVASAQFIIDNPADRARNYNVGERQIAEYLIAHGYTETKPGLFSPPG